VLAEIANDVKPGTIPWDISWYLPGYSDRFLMRAGLIELGKSIEQTQSKYDLTPNRSEILPIATKSHTEFGKALRDFLLD
jgi:hypothetical protein